MLLQAHLCVSVTYLPITAVLANEYCCLQNQSLCQADFRTIAVHVLYSASVTTAGADSDACFGERGGGGVNGPIALPPFPPWIRHCTTAATLWTILKHDAVHNFLFFFFFFFFRDSSGALTIKPEVCEYALSKKKEDKMDKVTMNTDAAFCPFVIPHPSHVFSSALVGAKGGRRLLRGDKLLRLHP